jgi:hypothetical protein
MYEIEAHGMRASPNRLKNSQDSYWRAILFISLAVTLQMLSLFYESRGVLSVIVMFFLLCMKWPLHGSSLQ